jgi:hypothetical protein
MGGYIKNMEKTISINKKQLRKFLERLFELDHNYECTNSNDVG